MVGERYLPGDFVKYNSNNGYVNLQAPDSEFAQAFSHFTFEASEGSNQFGFSANRTCCMRYK